MLLLNAGNFSPASKSKHLSRNVPSLIDLFIALFNEFESYTGLCLTVLILFLDLSAVSNNGISTTGTITSPDIRGNLTGKPIMPHVGMTVGSMRELISLLTSGTAYVNVHTQQHQNGEIRGQIGPAVSNILTNLS